MRSKSLLEGATAAGFGAFGAPPTIHGIVSVLSVGSLVTDVAVGWGLLPSQLGYLIGAVGLDVGLSMLALAYGIRFLLNLIPGAITRV